jgi:50S ribosomal subunit-associated GTPase HflX
VPRLNVFNKVDRLRAPIAPRTLEEWSGGHDFVALSSRDPDAVSRLRESILTIVRGASESAEVFVPYGAADATRLVYARCRVLQATPEAAGMRFVLEGEPDVLARIRRSRS